MIRKFYEADTLGDRVGGSLTVSDFIGGTGVVTFQRYKKGFFYLHVKNKHTGEIYEFFVPKEELGDVVIEPENKCVYFMRWIREALSNGTLTKVK